MFLSEWREFPSAPCFAGKTNLMKARVSMLLKSRASLTCFRACFLPGRAKDLSASRYIGQQFPLQQIQCRATFDTTIRFTRSNVELHSTSQSALPDPISSYFRHHSPLYQIQCRVAFDITIRFTSSNVELHSTSQSFLPYPMSSYIRHHNPLYQIQCRVTFDITILFTLSNVELHSTPHSAVPDRKSNYRLGG